MQKLYIGYYIKKIEVYREQIVLINQVTDNNSDKNCLMNTKINFLLKNK